MHLHFAYNIFEYLAYFALKMLNMLVQEEMKFKMELCEQQMEEVRGRREVEITYIKIMKSLNIAIISGRDHIH